MTPHCHTMQTLTGRHRAPYVPSRWVPAYAHAAANTAIHVTQSCVLNGHSVQLGASWHRCWCHSSLHTPSNSGCHNLVQDACELGDEPEEVPKKRKATSSSAASGGGGAKAAKKAKTSGGDWRAAAAAGELDAYTIPQLKDFLRSEELPVSGKKGDLISRLMKSMSDDA
jgi:SAP domain